MVIHFRDGQVAVTDERGLQLPEYQGSYESVRDRILADAGADVEFLDWRYGPSQCTREDFARPRN